MKIKCRSIKGNIVKIPEENITFRPAAYGVIMRNNEVLMQNVRSNNKLFFPGGGVDVGETIEDAIKREILEESGIKIKIEKFLTFREGFFYYDPLKEAYHHLSFYYLCKPLTFEILDREDVKDDEAGESFWMPLEQLMKNKDNLEVVNDVLKLL